MQPLVDREEEQARLANAADNPPQLVVLRGRRRVGKSFLIDRALEGRRAIAFQADEQPERGQLDALAREAARLIPGSPAIAFAGWDAAFEFFAARASDAPLTVVLDEFQWLVRAQPALPSILQRHWDGWQRAGTPLTIVLSGSAITLMEGLLAHGSPLFGRADYRPRLAPLDYRSAAAFARTGMSAESLVRRYGVLGGTPQYQVWAGTGALPAIIRERILGRGESLYEEPLHLLRGEQTIRDPGTYFAVLRAIAGGATQFNEIQQRAGTAKNLDVMLARLEELGYVEKREPVEAAGRRRSSYRIADPFFRFWFRYVFPNRSRLERGRTGEVLAEIEVDLDNFMGQAFEDCCRDWVARYAADALPVPERLGSWWSRDGAVEVDVAGMSNGRYELLGSCKWSRRARAGALADLLAARDRLGARAARAALVVFARGFDRELVARAADERVTLVSASDLF